jgi:prevent-host-death family protein
VEELTVSTFKATCLAVLERVRATGRPVLVTKRGVPIAEVGPPSPTATDSQWLGKLAGTGRLVDDLIAPVSDEWEALAP